MFQKLLRSPWFLRLIAILVHTFHIRFFQTKRVAFVFSWQLVSEVLSRDNDFRVEPVNGAKMKAVAGEFYLGLDRCPVSWRQRDAATRALAPSTDGLADWLEPLAREMLLSGIREQPVASIDVVGGYARLLACKTAIRVFGVPGPSETDLMETTRAIFHQTFLNLRDKDKGVRDRGIAAGKRLTRWILDEIDRRRRAGIHGDDFLGYLMDRPDAWMTDDERAVILSGHLVGAIDTTTTAFAYIAREVVSDIVLLRKVRRDLPRPGDPPDIRADKNRYMTGWCYEALRRRPQAPFLMRVTGADVELDGKTIPAGKLVLAVTSAAHFDPNAYPAPGRMDPERPVENYFHFGGGAHICAGRNINAVQLRVLLQVLLAPQPVDYEAPKKTKRNEHRPDWAGKLDYDGPFPDQLTIRFVE